MIEIPVWLFAMFIVFALIGIITVIMLILILKENWEDGFPYQRH